jgi:hypothetical protein
MMKQIALASLIVGFAAPAMAQEYYIVRGPDKRCRVVETRPTDQTVVVIGDKAFVSRDEAERQVRVVCKDEEGNTTTTIEKK